VLVSDKILNIALWSVVRYDYIIRMQPLLVERIQNIRYNKSLTVIQVLMNTKRSQILIKI